MKKLLAISIVTIAVGVQLLLATRRDGSDSVRVQIRTGPVNTVVISKGDARVVIYGDPDDAVKSAETVLLTHHRRDVAWSARRLIEAGAAGVGPAAERELIESPQQFWTAFVEKRFHDYSQQTTKILTRPLQLQQWVREGDIVRWRGMEFKVLDTPGYTRGAVTYVADLDGKRMAFCGDLIYAGGKLLDLYSLQDAIPEAQIRGYHGYAGRLKQLLESLDKVLAAKPDVLVPARGPVIDNPRKAVDALRRRVRAVYRNYLSTNALNWYFKEKRMRICGERVLGKGADVELMSYSEYRKAPAWVQHFSTSRVLLSKNKHAFILDCWSKRVLDSIEKFLKEKGIDKVDGIFVTHCHDDHTDFVQSAAKKLKCPVYALENYADALARPTAYHLPAQSDNAIANIHVMRDGEKMRWQEFRFTFRYFPGQMYHHGALLVEKNGERPIFFIGDSFSPSGMDDYCLLNRNLMRDGEGYLRCLRIVRGFRGNYWLVNEHIPFVFRFSNKELDYLEGRYRQRMKDLAELFPWDNLNYGIDEQWVAVYPYGDPIEPKQEREFEIRITNHSPVVRKYRFTVHVPKGAELLRRPSALTVAAGKTGKVTFRLRAPAQPGVRVLTVDVSTPGMTFHRWAEAMIVTRQDSR